MRDFFETMTDCRIVGEAEDVLEAIHKASELRADLILLDFSMPGLNGIETASTGAIPLHRSSSTNAVRRGFQTLRVFTGTFSGSHNATASTIALH
jgi:DNA-binding NarL/FixJ family response regulator